MNNQTQTPESLPCTLADTLAEIQQADTVIAEAVKRRMKLRLHLRKLERIKNGNPKESGLLPIPPKHSNGIIRLG